MMPLRVIPLRPASLALAYLLTATLTIASRPATADSQEVGRTTIPVGSLFPGERAWQIELSDDGRYLVYQTNHGDGWKLFLHELGQPTPHEIAGLGDTPYYASISHDNQWLLFGKKGAIYKAPLAGGDMTLLYMRNNWNTWESGQTFLVQRGAGGIWRVRADGSMADEQIAAVDTSVGATNYGRPSLLPDGKGLLVSVGLGTGVDLRRIGIITLPDGKLTLLDALGVTPRYSKSGHILYTQSNSLKAMPFDVDRLRPTGPSVTVVEGVHVYPNQASQFDISDNGILVYVPGPSEIGRSTPRTLVWVDRDGNERPFDTPAERGYAAVQLSPNGRYLAAQVGSTLQLFDRTSGTWRFLLEEGASDVPLWSPDSRTVFANRGDALGRVSVDEGAAWESRIDAFYPSSAFEGRVFGVTIDDRGMRHLMSATLDPASQPKPLLESTRLSRRSPMISPDGRWLAYVEKDGGNDRVWVQPYPDGGPATLVSEGDAVEPAWGRTSDELFYRNETHMVSVTLRADPVLRVKNRTPLFPVDDYYRYINTFATVYDYDPVTDRFLMVRRLYREPPGADVQVIRNAFELLDRIAPGR